MKRGAIHHHQIFDCSLACEFPLPELPRASDSTGGLSIRLAAPETVDPAGFEPCFDWRGPGGRVVCSSGRKGDEKLLSWPGYVDFLFEPGDRISCFANEDCPGRTLRHLLICQALPRHLGSQGRLVLHASAVRLPSGDTVAFVGPSGRGKSTLAASFHRHGARILADDCVMLESRENALWIIGAYPGVRLFPDSMHALYEEGRGFVAVTSYTDKQQALLHRGRDAGNHGWHRLDALILLAAPGSPGKPPRVACEVVRPSTALVALLGSIFSLDPSMGGDAIRDFQAVAQAVRAGPPVFELVFPHRHERLADVRDCVEKQLSGPPAVR